ncbi:hypothetical protein QQ045_019042 [Rhodiola kirilowii]
MCTSVPAVTLQHIQGSKVAGLYNGSATNLVKPSGLAPFGVKGVFDGAAIVYFSYLGYDSVSTMAKEITNPSEVLPI